MEPVHAVSVVLGEDLKVHHLSTLLDDTLNIVISVHDLEGHPSGMHFKVQAELEDLKMLEFVLVSVIVALRNGKEVANEMISLKDIDAKVSEVFAAEVAKNREQAAKETQA